MSLNRDMLIGIYASALLPTPGSIISNFSVTTTSGTITVDWGDGTSQIISSSVPTSKSYLCPSITISGNFWKNINPC